MIPKLLIILLKPTVFRITAGFSMPVTMTFGIKYARIRMPGNGILIFVWRNPRRT